MMFSFWRFKMKNFYSQLPDEKIKINGNKNPVPMKLFLSFLTIQTQKQTDFLGSCNGWTQYTGDNRLVISGGIVNGKEYLDHILYKKNLDNPYNNFVNPFYLFEIMNDDGKKFFLDYYSKEIAAMKNKAYEKVKSAKINLEQAIKEEIELATFWYSYKIIIDPEHNPEPKEVLK